MRFTSVACALAILSGCVSARTSDKDVRRVLDAYAADNKSIEQRNTVADAGIKVLTIAPANGTFNVTADLDHARLDTVMQRVFTTTKSGYVFERPLTGMVTARFENLPLQAAVDVLLGARGLHAEMQSGVFVIRGGHAIAATAAPVPAASQPMIDAHVDLESLDVTSATTMLTSLYPPASSGGPAPAVQFGVQPNTNSVYLIGAADAVARTVDILREADQEPPHVLIEAMVVEFDRDALERVGLDIVNAANKSLSGVNLNLGSLLREAITFTKTTGAHNPRTFTALIDLLQSRNQARLVSRPYVSTLSGIAATINITNNRYVVSQGVVAGTTVVTPQAVPSGVTLTITPTVTGSDRIRLVANVTDSQFIPTSGNVAVEVDQNQASTTMLLEDGQSMVIGGLTLDRTSDANSGVPFLRSIPILNVLFANQERDRTQEEVLIVVTPHIWVPGMHPPLVEPDAFSIMNKPGER